VSELAEVSFFDFSTMVSIVNSKELVFEIEGEASNTLVPFADSMRHHKPIEANCYSLYDLGEQAVCFKAVMSIKKGEEVSHCFG
jgi:hypothetical protein